MSALPPIADIRRCRWDVRKVPKADIWFRRELPCAAARPVRISLAGIALRILRLPQGFYAAKNRSSSRWRDEPSPTSGDHRHRPRQKLGSDAWGSFRSAFGYGLGPR